MTKLEAKKFAQLYDQVQRYNAALDEIRHEAFNAGWEAALRAVFVPSGTSIDFDRRDQDWNAFNSEKRS